MNTYTQEEFILLSNMLRMNFWDYPQGIISTDDVISKIIKFSCSESMMKSSLLEKIMRYYYDQLNRLIKEEPLNQVPRYMNKPEGIKVVAHWRLKIGK